VAKIDDAGLRLGVKAEGKERRDSGTDQNGVLHS